MKLSSGSILIGSSTEIAVLNDPTLVPTEVLLWVRGTYGGILCTSNGYQDDSGLKAVKYNTSRSSSYPIIVNNGTVLLQGYVSLWDVGEFTITFPTRVTGNSYTVEYLAIER